MNLPPSGLRRLPAPLRPPLPPRRAARQPGLTRAADVRGGPCGARCLPSGDGRRQPVRAQRGAGDTPSAPEASAGGEFLFRGNVNSLIYCYVR